MIYPADLYVRSVSLQTLGTERFDLVSDHVKTTEEQFLNGPCVFFRCVCEECFFKKISVNEGIHIQKVEHVNYQL